MRHALFALPLALLAAPAFAQSTTGEPTINQVIVYGDDACPPSTEEVITVCARLPDEERYRIPENMRDDPNNPSNQAWQRRAQELSVVGRTGTESCSTVGPGGFTGCLNQVIQQARAERRTDERINWNQLIDEARQERLRRIEEQIMQEEAELQEAERNRPE